jgi:hypothetical protein
MIRSFFSLFFLVALVCSLGLLVVPGQPVSAGMGGAEDPGSYPGAYWSLWPGGSVPVFISNGFQGDGEKDMIWQGLNTWRDRTGYAIEFNEIFREDICSSCPISPEDTCSYCRYVYILTPEEYNALFPSDPPVSGCSSWGPHTEGATYTILSTPNAPGAPADAPNCINLPSIIHEIGHAIGLGHEQLRPDRGFYMTFEDPFVPKWQGDNEPDPWPECTGPDPVGFFDYYSYMHTRTHHAIPLSPDVIWPLPFFPFGGPSNGDIDTVRALYGFNIHYNFDIVGGDYASFPLENDPTCVSTQKVDPACESNCDMACLTDPNHIVPTQRRCQLACAADVRCKAYTYVGIGLLDTTAYPDNVMYPYCFLKDDVSIPTSVPEGMNIHSGMRKPDQKCSFGAAFNVDLVAGQISGGVVDMPHNLLNGNNCKDLCAQDPMCDAFTFVPGMDSGTCYKKTHKPVPPEPPFTYQRRDGYMSGVIRKAGDPLNLAPTSDAGGPYTAEWAGIPTTVALDGTGSSDPEGASLAYFWTTDCPAFNTLTFNEPTSPQPILTVNTSASCCFTCNVSLIVRDDQCFRSTRDSATVTIQDTTPPALIGVPADQTLECDATVPPPATVSATDSCDTNVVPTFTETRVDGSCAANYTLRRTWTAVDDCGNSTSATQTITVQDTEGPRIVCNDDAFITPSQAPISFTATATDKCGDATVQITGFDCVGKKGKSKLESCVVTFSGSTVTIHNSGGVGNTISWTVQATDSCGNITNRTCDTSVVNLPEYRKIYE